MKDAADERGLAMSKDDSRQIVYGMSYEDWKSRHQPQATAEQQKAFDLRGSH
jgi:hypothetical protein